MIPEIKKEAVKQALQLTFGVDEFEDISELRSGLSSALIFRIVVLGEPYLLRIITRTDEISNPSHWYACMTAASDAGLAPQVWYMGIEDRISITDFIEAKPFPIHEARTRMPEVMKRLHALPPFPYRMDYLDKMDGFVRKFQAANILPEAMTAELLRQYERIKSVYPYDNHDLVSCHNDLKAENFLFDGDRVFLVDWEAAFLNDCYLDLAVVANFVVTTDDEEKNYLSRYFGEEVSEYNYARFFLMRQMLHLFYFAFLLPQISAAGTPIVPDMPKRDFRSFHEGMWSGEITLAGNEARQEYALIHMEQMLQNLRLRRFEDSLNIVADYQAQ